MYRYVAHSDRSVFIAVQLKYGAVLKAQVHNNNSPEYLTSFDSKVNPADNQNS